VHVFACEGLPPAEIAAQHFMDNILRLNGLSDVIVSDHGAQFSFKLWRRPCSPLMITLSIGYHPQTDRQTHQVNHPFLWFYTLHQWDGWPAGEFAYDKVAHRASPFLLTYGPHLGIWPSDHFRCHGYSFVGRFGLANSFRPRQTSRKA